jgi:hypothetical protein
MRRRANRAHHVLLRHASGIIPQDADPIASGALQSESDWKFKPFTVGKDADRRVGVFTEPYAACDGTLVNRDAS